MVAMRRRKANFKRYIVTGIIVLGLLLVSASAAFCIYASKAEVNENTVIMMLASLVLWLTAVAAFIAVSFFSYKYEKTIYRQDKMLREFLDVFSSFVDAKDSYTYGHSRRVAKYSLEIAEQLGFPDEKCSQAYRIALLHDLGKCFIPDEILKKPGVLTQEEIEKIRLHPVKGAEMVKGLSLVPGIYDGILYHHERFDGKGYPTGKKGEEIPLIARIIAVPDAFDAMTSDRVYRKKLSKEEAVKELKDNSGTQFDPKIVDAFLKVLEQKK